MIAIKHIPLRSASTEPDASIVAKYDSELVRRFVGGDKTAFNEIVSRYKGKIFATALRLLHNHADAEEMTQDTFIRAYRALESFRGDSSLSTWLYTIVTNLSRNRYWYYFRRRRQDTLSLDYQIVDGSDLTFAGCIASDARSPAQEVVVSEFEAVVSNCLRQLSWQHREILEMRMLEHRTYEYMAEALCISSGTVKSRVARARQALLCAISQSCPELRGDDLTKLLRGDRIKSLVEAI